MRRTLILAVGLALLAPATARAQDAPLATAQLDAPYAGEAKLALTASATGADWVTPGSESALLEVDVDGKPVTDVVTFFGALPLEYDVALGHVDAGPHTVTVSLDAAKSPVKTAAVTALKPTLAPAGDLVARYAPVLYGRNLPTVPGEYENVDTDAPLLSYHTSSVDAAGNRTIEYTMIWSNEDGGTNTPSLMARWGRTTDIEWLYRVVVDKDGNRVSDAYQSSGHGTLPFDGIRENDHPLLQVVTSNNNMAAVTNTATSSGYRFFLDTADEIDPATTAREEVMDRHPWSYQVMDKEMIREGKVEKVADPATAAMSDQRNYLYAVVRKHTSYATPPRANSWAGVALAAEVGGTWYTSNHGVAGDSLQRDDPAATTVELPPGTTPADVQALKAFAVPNGTPGSYSIDVTAINRGLMLGNDYLPGTSFINWTGTETLTPQRTEAVIWQNANVIRGGAGGSVPATLALTLGAAPSFGAFTPGVEKTYTAATTATVTSTAADAALSVSAAGHLTNGAFALPDALQTTLSKSVWTGPASNDAVAVGLSQHIGAGDALRSGSYTTTLTYTLSTQNP